MRFGIQLYPPCIAPQMADFAARAMAQYAFDKVWVPDHLTYENVFVILAAIIARTGAHVGTSVVQPFSRTPVDLASSFASLAHLAGDRGITVGIGAGSPSSNMIRKRNRVGMTREMILFLREMFAGDGPRLPASQCSRIFFGWTARPKPSFACRRRRRRRFTSPPPIPKCSSSRGMSAMAKLILVATAHKSLRRLADLDVDGVKNRVLSYKDGADDWRKVGGVMMPFSLL